MSDAAERLRRRYPPARLPRPMLVALVAAIAATAWGVWTYVVPHRAEVPALAGIPLDEARDRLAEMGFAVRIADARHSDRIAAGSVLRVPLPLGGRSVCFHCRC